MKLRPTQDTVFIKVTKYNAKGLSEAVVLAVGPGRIANDGVTREPMDVRVDDRVLVTEVYDRSKVLGFRGKCYLVDDYSIQAVLEPEPAPQVN